MLTELNQRIQKQIEYVVRMEPGVQTPEETLTLGRGSCRDSGWLMVQLLRHLGFAARFVSGYLIQLVARTSGRWKARKDPTSDFTDLHAWCEVYLPGAGWIGLDATSGLLAGEGHIPLAASPDPTSAAPISGMVEKCETTFDVEMTIRRILETPRVTKPYTETQWRAILDKGAAVDRSLARGDVRLTMGGEPTFVSATDLDAPEWNTEAVGPTKRAYADRLIRRLMTRWTSGAALQYVMGKQYPGEQLPRWAFHCLWRADGEPVWRDPALFARGDRDRRRHAEGGRRFRRPARGAAADRSRPASFRRMRTRIITSGARAGCPPTSWPRTPNSLDPLERARLARVFGQGLASRRRQRAAVAPRDGQRLPPLAVRHVVLPLRRDVPDPRQLPHRPPPSSGEHSLG